MARNVVIYCFFLPLFFGVACSEPTSVMVDNLTTELMQNPVGLDVRSPLLSWQLKSGGRNIKQASYRILAATKPGLLKEGEADLWDSGVVKSDQSAWVPYKGRPLNSGEVCYWSVKISDSEDNNSAYSEPAFFEMGLLNPEDWKGAQWIGIENDSRKSDYKSRPLFTWRMSDTVYKVSHPSPLLRKGFNLESKVVKARLYITAAGYFEAYINGEKVSNSVLDPAPTSFDKHILYRVFDVTELLKSGPNIMAAIAANGFYGQNIAFGVPRLQYGEPGLLALLNIELSDGSVVSVPSNDSWKAATGPIVFDNVYGGETYDARYEISDWNQIGIDDSHWQKAHVKPHPGGKLRFHKVDPIRVIKELKPRRILKRGEKYVVEFPENTSGWVKISMDEPKGSVVTIRTGEAMYRDSSGLSTESTGHFATGLVQTQTYISNGSGPVTWQPGFSYQGFQYAEVSGLSRELKAEDIHAVVVYTDLSEKGAFNSSSEHLNKMFEISRRTLMTNMHGFPEDCPHREKCGWLGDAHTTADFAIYSYDLRNLYVKFMQDIKDNFIRGRELYPGYVPPMVPQMVAPGKRSIGEAYLDWGIALQLIPWYVYNYYGDASLYEEYYDHIKDFTRHMLAFKNEEGTIDNGLGDWCPPLWDRLDNPDAMECDPFISGSAILYNGLDISIKMAGLFGDDAYKTEMVNEAAALKKAFNKRWLQAIGDTLLWYGSQTATILALEFGLVPDNAEYKVVAGLVYDINELKGGHHSVGIHGHKYLYTLLSKLGYADLAFNVLTNETFPGHGYIVNSGVTTWPERQYKYGEEEWDRSMNHPMNANFAHYHFNAIGGIKTDAENPGFKQFYLDPVFPSDLDFASVSHTSLYGEISSNWKRTANGISWEILVPHNTTALVCFSVDKIDDIKEESLDDLKPYAIDGDKKVVLKIGSGSYHFRF